MTTVTMKHPKASVQVNPAFSYLRLNQRNTPLDRGFGKTGDYAQQRYPIGPIRKHAAAGGNLGVRTGKQSTCFVLDVDPRNGGDESLALLVEKYGALPATYTVRSGGGGWHFYFRLPDFEVASGTNVLGPGLDIKGEHSYVVAPGSVHARTGALYEVTRDAAIAPPPPWLVELLRHRRNSKSARSQRVGSAEAPSKVAQPDPCCEAMARKALASIARRMDQLAALGERKRMKVTGKPRGWDDGYYLFALRLIEVARWPYATVTLEEAEKVFFAHVPEDQASFHPDHKWSSAKASAGDWFLGTDHRYKKHVSLLPKMHSDEHPAPDAEELADEGRSTFTDARLAHHLAAQLQAQGSPVLYSHGLGWFTWDGTRWRPTDAGEIKGLIMEFALQWLRRLAHERAPSALMDKVTGLLNESRASRLVRAMEALIRVDAGDFDSHPDLLNCRNGVVDLRTSTLVPHDPKLLMTKVTRVAYQPAARSNDWEKAKQALEPEILDYFLDRLGQAVTGHTPSDDRIPFNVGVGGNGKSTLLDPVRLCLGDYAGAVTQKLLLANASEHPTEFMTLRGLRLAVLEELPEQGRLNTQRLKTIVGTETIQARGMRQDFVEFRTTHALFVNTNHAPNVIETDHGTWRRLQLVAFERKYRTSDGSIDETLRQRVKRRPVLEAALADLIAHARRWYDNERVMPAPPAAVERATAAWRRESDDLLGYFTERLQVDASASIRFSDVLDDFNGWLGERGNRGAWSDKLLSGRLAANEALPVPFQKGQRSRHYVNRLGSPVRSQSPVTVWKGVRFRS
jgi:putative DNA primase/helicase